MIETEKAALRERLATMSMDDKFIEIIEAIRDPYRKCETVRALEEDIHGNGKPGLAVEIQRFRWTVSALSGLALLCGIIATLVALLGG